MCGSPKSLANINANDIIKQKMDAETFQIAMAEQGIVMTVDKAKTQMDKNCGTCGRSCGIGDAVNNIRAYLATQPT